MLKGFIFDIETNGLLDKLDTIHCIAVTNTDTGEIIRANDHGSEHTIEATLKWMMEVECLIGHNILRFDIPAIQKVYPWFQPKGRLLDTLAMSRLIYANLKELDFAYRRKHPDFPGQLIGSHSLEAWGIRLGEWKGDYAKLMKEQGRDPWAEWNQDMDDYCEQDVVVTHKLWDRLLSRGFSEESIQLEHDVARILARQEAYGVLFDEEVAWKLSEELLVRRAELTDQLTKAFPPWMRAGGPTKAPKRSQRRKVSAPVGEYHAQYTKDAEYTPIEQTVFNPGSRQHIADRLIAKYDWKPKQYTNSGQVQIDESVLEGLKYPEAKLLNEYLLVEKRLGQITEGKQAWVKAVEADGRIHGRVNTMGAVTGRMTHSSPNLAQVPKVGSPYGEECRSMFTVPAGKKLVGCDASGLELRCLAHYMGRWDGGAYAHVILNGDIHSENQKAAGLPTRDNAKTFI